MYRIVSMGGRLLAQTVDHDAAWRMASRIAAEAGRYVELHMPSGHVEYVYPARVMA